MKYRHLGKSGLQLSELSFGAWVTFAQQISNGTAEELMTIAYDGGANFFDNAEAYAEGRAEIVMGNILKKKGWPRDTFVVSSKVFWGGDRPNQEGLSRKHVIEACHAALRRLLEKVKQLAKVAGDLGVTLPKLALAWCLKNPNVSTVITGASKPQQVRENMKAGEVVDQLDEGVMKRIESILQGT